MKVFVLEDDPTRLLWFRERLLNHDVTYADSVTQADRFVGPYDLVCFDHDLGGRQMDEHEDDGAAFAELIKDRIGDARVIVHSYNAAGARDIAAVLDGRARGVIAPFRGQMFNACLDAWVPEKVPA